MLESEDIADDSQPQLFLVATPIGNLEDMSYRAVRILSEVDAIACEDTRHTRKLLSHYGVETKRLLACHDHNERQSAGGIVSLIEQGQRVALVSDAGMPVVNDPGYRVVSAVREAGLKVTLIPGPSAVLTALVLSGLPPHEFAFLGFPPRKTGQRQNWLRKAKRHACTLVMMEAPHRLPELLADALEVMGDVPGSVSLELTKRYESTTRGPMSELVAAFPEPPKGEVMVTMDAAQAKPDPEPEGGEGGRRRKGKRARREAGLS